jgi:hypothetical protein
MNNKKIYTIGTVPKSISKIVERGKMDTHKYMTLMFLTWYNHFNK